MEKDDRYIIERIKKGDKYAFRQLFERYFPLFLSFARRLMRDDHAAEDIVQTVFMRIWDSREKLDPEKNIRNFLLVAVRNEVFFHLRESSRRRHEYDIPEVQDQSVGVERRMALNEMEQDIRKIVEDMPERRKEVFIMSRQESLSNKEIAERLGLSVRTVEKHIENALSDIRHKFPVS